MTNKQPDFEFPGPEENAKIWRYMSFEKYVSMLQTNALHFAGIRQLQKEDPYEGSCFPSKYLQNGCYKGQDLNAFSGESPPLVSAIRAKEEKHLKEIIILNSQEVNRLMLVNCWHCNEDESMAMWRIYGKDKGIAIQSTYSCLQKSLEGSKINKQNTNSPIRTGLVKYLDYKTEVFHDDGKIYLYDEVMHKQIAYDFEKELRVVLFTRLTGNATPCYAGWKISVDLNTLIENIFISPFAQSNLKDIIDKENKKYGLSNKEVIPSQLLVPPLY